MKISEIENITKMQINYINMITELINYDKENGKPAENTRVLTAFCDTQRKSLEMIQKLIEKHKPALEEEEKKEREKREAERKLELAKKKEESKKENLQQDLEKAKTDDTSLFSFAEESKDTKQACILDEETEEKDDYSFEESDMGSDEE